MSFQDKIIAYTSRTAKKMSFQDRALNYAWWKWKHFRDGLDDQLAPAKAGFSKNGIRAYWYRDIKNFGDLLTPFLLKHYGYEPVFSSPSKASFVSTGSNLDIFPNDFQGLILGSGFIDENSDRLFPQASILAVRGLLTRKKLKRGKEVKLGDPGLLISTLLPKKEGKIFKVGILPHYAEKKDPKYLRLSQSLEKQIKIIDVQQEPQRVLTLIAQCQTILSSSLHGLIAADSLHIPSRWVGSQNLLGGRFKFDDYYSSLSLREKPLVLTGNETLPELTAFCKKKPEGKIEKMKEELDRLWRSLSRERNRRPNRGS